MASTASWVWQGTGTWPGFTPSGGNPIGAGGNGLKVDPTTFTQVTWNDTNNDGIVADADADGGPAGETVTFPTGTKTVQEVGRFTGSTMEFNGTAVNVPMIVWVFQDGSYAVRINDADIPKGVHHDAVTKVQLGRWDGTEYNGSYVVTRDEPFLCFAAGTLILTDKGPRPVEALCPGDHVQTYDHGLQPLRWIGRRRVMARDRMAPVGFCPGAIGNRRPLLVSPQHRVLIQGWRAELHFGESEVLVPALALVNGDTICRRPMDSVDYVHLLFDRHEIVWSEGALTESFHPGAYGLSVLDQAARAEVLALFPELSGPQDAWPAARPCLRPREAGVLRSQPPG